MSGTPVRGISDYRRTQKDELSQEIGVLEGVGYMSRLSFTVSQFWGSP